MQLAAPLFEQIVVALQAPSAAPTTPADRAVRERRRESRVGVQARVTLIPLTGDATLAPGPVAVLLRDLSPGGIRFLHPDRVSLDEQFVVLLPHVCGNDSVAVLCHVAYYQPLAARLFAVGARFVRVLRQPAAEPPETLPLDARPGAARRAAS